LELLPMPALLLGRDGVIQGANPGACQLLGGGTPLAGRAIAGMLPPSFQKNHLLGGADRDAVGEIEFNLPAGILPAKVRVQWRGGIGLMLLEDLRSQRRRDKQIALRDSFRAAILDSASYAIISADTEGSILFFNPAAEKMLGWSASELVGRQTPAIFHDPDEVAAEAAALSREFNQEIAPGFRVFVHRSDLNLPNERIWTYIRRDGRRIQVNLSITAVRDSGQLLGYTGIAVDVTEKLLTENQLKNLIRALEHHAIVAITDAKGDITYCNELFCKISGYSRDELLGRNHRILNSGHHPRDFFVDMWRQIASGRIWQGEVRNRAKDGRLYWVSTTIMPVLGRDGRPEQYVSMRTDITAIKDAEIAMAQARQAAESAAQAKGDFLANMSHEIRTPLNGVIGMTQVLLDGQLSPEQRENADLIRSSGETLLSLLNDILDFSKIEAKQVGIESIPFDLRRLAEECADTHALSAYLKDVGLHLLLDPGLPEQFRGDPMRLKQVLNNLLGNAVKFTAAGSVALEIRWSPAGGLGFSVSDTGIGIPQDKLAKLFQPFSQVDNSISRRFGGTGLGLVISQALVNLMGGRIEVDSREGGGTTFRFSLSLPPLELSAATPCATSFRLLGGSPAARREAVMAVESLGARLEDDGEVLLCLDPQAIPQGSFRKRFLLLPRAACGKAGDFRQDGWDALLPQPLHREVLRQALGSGDVTSEARHALPMPVKQGRILVAEDNPVNQKVISKILLKMGQSFLLAENGRVAMEQFSLDGSIDLILMDLMMPEMDGHEATRRIRQLPGGEAVPIIALTASAMESERQACLSAGMNEYLTKPVSAQALQKILDRFLPEKESR
jgi:PAS domain S-box-containing protein